MASHTVLVIGSRGALGRAIGSKFRAASWKGIFCDVNEVSDDDHRYCIELPRATAIEQYEVIKQRLDELRVPEHSIRAIINVSGGFRMDNAKSEAIFESMAAMYSSSVESSTVAAHIASQYLSPGGLLVLPGAASCLVPTPWALSYGAMKAAVHHMVKSLGSKNAGLPDNSIVVGIAPSMLDTEANRRAMPDADRSTWTPVDFVADKILDWVSQESVNPPESGTIFKIVTKNNITEFIKV